MNGRTERGHIPSYICMRFLPVKEKDRQMTTEEERNNEIEENTQNVSSFFIIQQFSDPYFFYLNSYPTVIECFLYYA